METSRGLRKRRLSPSVADAKRQRRQRPPGLVDFVRPSQAVAWRQPGPVSGVVTSRQDQFVNLEAVCVGGL